MEIPNLLVEQIRDGQVVLFLGAGASIGALHKDNKKPPIGQILANLIADEFLSSDFHDHPLAQVAELAISETDLFTVQEYIASLFEDFYPNTFHKLIPRFLWKAIATTNYDLIVERAYEIPEAIQRLVVFKKNGEKVEKRLSGNADVVYMKLHGSITDINDREIPLILTPDQYVLYKKNRSRLFERLTYLSTEYPVLFIGHSMSDSNLRALLLELSELGEARPRFYLVNPTITEQEIRFWEGRRITSIKTSFKDFIEYIDSTIPATFRGLAVINSRKAEHAIFNRFSSTNAKPSASLLTFLSRDVDYLHKGFRTGKTEPKEFYKGYFPNWDPIEMGLDVRRGIADGILSEVFLATEEEKAEKQELIAILGYAGSGKTVILRRVAWDGAIEYDKLCLAIRPSMRPEYEPLYELYTLCKERIFLFIDPATDNIDLIKSFLVKARRDKFPLTIITAERPNEWNAYCDSLHPYLTYDYEVGYLNQKEVKQLIELLTRHKSLGYLEEASFDEQMAELSERAGRQILVALYEATEGKPFQDIVFNEYQNIPSSQARLLYLSVCILHRLGVVTRAGVIARVHGISFTLFKENLFRPLEFIVFATENKLIGDFEYQTRHQQIAEMVFERVLVEPQDRYDEYIRILGALDVDFNSDRDAFRGMVNTRELKRLFPEAEMIRSLFQVAKTRSPKDPMILQQEAIFEIGVPDGDLQKATELLNEAHKLAPWNQPIAHSLSELALRKAERATSPLERNKFRKESRELASEIKSKLKDDPHAYHTLIKIGLSELEDVLIEGDESVIEIKLKGLQKTISSALQLFPEESFILEADARFNKLINDNPKALESLRKAFQKNKKTPYIALRLTKMLQQSGNSDEALKVLREAVEANQQDKDLNFNLGMMLLSSSDAKPAEIKHYLRNSFTTGDTRYVAQLWYARFIYLEGDVADAKEIFKTLQEANIDIKLKNQPRGKVFKDNVPVRFKGAINKIEASYGFLIRDQIGDGIFIYRFNENQDLWDTLMRGTRVSFNLAFNYRGPIALNLGKET